MKKLKKLLALLLALTMVFCLAACAAKDDNDEGKSSSKKETIVGEWVCEIDMSDALGEYLAEALGDEDITPNTKLRMNITFDFTDDGEFEMAAVVNEGDFEKYMEKLLKNMVDYMYEMFEDQGMSKSDVDEEFEAEYGMSVEEYVDEYMETAMEDAIDEMTFEFDTMYYKLDKKAGQIFVTEDEDELEDATESLEYELDGEELTISAFLEDGEEVDTPFEQYGFDLPWVFEKQ